MAAAEKRRRPELVGRAGRKPGGVDAFPRKVRNSFETIDKVRELIAAGAMKTVDIARATGVTVHVVNQYKRNLLPRGYCEARGLKWTPRAWDITPQSYDEEPLEAPRQRAPARMNRYIPIWEEEENRANA